MRPQTETAVRLWKVLVRDYIRPAVKSAGLTRVDAEQYQMRSSVGDVAAIRFHRHADVFTVSHAVGPVSVLEWNCHRFEVPPPVGETIPWAYLCEVPGLTAPVEYWLFRDRWSGPIPDELREGMRDWSIGEPDGIEELGSVLRSRLEEISFPLLRELVDRMKLLDRLNVISQREFNGHWRFSGTREWSRVTLAVGLLPRAEVLELLRIAVASRAYPEREAWVLRKLDERFADSSVDS